MEFVISNCTEHYLPAKGCPEWRPLQNVSFHFSMLFFLFASAIPYTKKYVLRKTKQLLLCKDKLLL